MTDIIELRCVCVCVTKKSKANVLEFTIRRKTRASKVAQQVRALTTKRMA